MPHFLHTFGDASRPPVGAVIIEAPSMLQARRTAVTQRLAPGVPFGESLKLTAKAHDRGATCLAKLAGSREPFLLAAPSPFPSSRQHGTLPSGLGLTIPETLLATADEVIQ
jgi:hypothetical protein